VEVAEETAAGTTMKAAERTEVDGCIVVVLTKSQPVPDQTSILLRDPLGIPQPLTPPPQALCLVRELALCPSVSEHSSPYYL